jgi:hypothetical protein
MAVAHSPCLSFDARKSVAKTLTFCHRHRQTEVYPYTVPRDPCSTGQLAQRALLSQVVKTWRYIIYLQPVKEVWRTNAHARRSGLSAYAEAIHIIWDTISTPPPDTFAVEMHSFRTANLQAALFDVAHFAQSAEYRTLRLFSGTTPNQLLYVASYPPTSTELTCPLPDPIGTVKYYQLRMGTKPYSAITRLTVGSPWPTALQVVGSETPDLQGLYPYIGLYLDRPLYANIARNSQIFWHPSYSCYCLQYPRWIGTYTRMNSYRFPFPWGYYKTGSTNVLRIEPIGL